MATALGASMIEKHFTIDQLIKGNSPDHTSSLTPSQLKATIEAIRFVENSGITDPIEAVHAYREHAKIPQEEITYTDEDLETALGDGVKKPTESELKIMSGIRKSITAIREVKEGQQITKDDIDIKRPTGGFHPREYEQLVSNELPFLATKDISIDAPINEENCNLTPRK